MHSTVQPIYNNDKSLINFILILLTFGIIMVYDATVVYSQDIFGNSYKLVLSQLGWCFLGLLGFSLFYNLNYHKLFRLAVPLFFISISMLFVLAIIALFPCSDTSPAFAPCINGANRWFFLNPSPLPKLPFFGVVGFQPSELAKLTIIIYLAAQLSIYVPMGAKTVTDYVDDAFFIYIIPTCIVSALIVLQPNMSTASLLFIICTCLYIVSGASLKPLLLTLPPLGFLAVSIMFLFEHTRARIMTLIMGGTSGVTYHIDQILIALGSGGFYGIGFGQSRQKLQYLPEVAADSIFAVIGEEFGYIGSVLVILGFCFLIYKGYRIAQLAPDLFGRLLAVGVTVWIWLQFFVNIGAMSRILPLTGVPIPLISYGGSSMVFTLMGLGILANINKYAKVGNYWGTS